MRRSCLASLFAVLILGLPPATAAAWEVTVRVHGAGAIDETTAANLLNCAAPITSVTTNTTVYDCKGGTPSGDYGHGWIVNLEAYVPATYFNRGWRFSRWVDGNDAGQINCDPQDVTGDHFGTGCKFQIFANLFVDLYFVDVAGPDVTLGPGGPSGTVGSPDATFTFDSADPHASYECRLQRQGAPPASFQACGSPADETESYGGLTSGTYTVTVRGKDPQGNTNGTADSRTWTVDRTAPSVAFEGGPPARTNQESATFTWTADEPVSNFECSRNGGAWSPCVSGDVQSGFTAEITHNFSVRGTDPYGNTGAGAVYSWTVDKTPPQTTITAGPDTGSVSSSSTIAFTFSSEPGATYRCSVDGGAAFACSSPRTITGLAPGAHSFSVAATDVAGNTDPSPAQRSWTVVPPDADGDGFDARKDCDDTDASRHRGAKEVPGNGKDEDCDGSDADFPVVSAGISYRWKVAGGRTSPKVLKLTRVLPGSTVTVRCKGKRKACPFRSKVLKGTGRVLDLKPLFAGRKLKAGTVVRIRVSAPGMTSKLVQFRMRRHRTPAGGSFRCRRPGSSRTIACPAV